MGYANSVAFVLVTVMALSASAQNKKSSAAKEKSKKGTATQSIASPKKTTNNTKKAIPPAAKPTSISTPQEVPTKSQITEQPPAPVVKAKESTSSEVRTSIRQDAWGIGLIGWPEKVKVTDEFGASHDANVQFYSPSLHYVARDIRARYGYAYEGYFFYGKADIENESGASLTYFQKRVGIYGLGAVAGAFYRPAAKQITLGVSALTQYRQAKFTAPPNGGSVSNKSAFALGYMFDFRWRITQDIGINQRVGQLIGHKGSYWMFNLEWTL